MHNIVQTHGYSRTFSDITYIHLHTLTYSYIHLHSTLTYTNIHLQEVKTSLITAVLEVVRKE